MHTMSQTDTPSADSQAEEESLPDPHHLEQQRRENRDAIAALGVNPYGERSAFTDAIVRNAEALARYDADADEQWGAITAKAKEAAKEQGKTLPPAPSQGEGEIVDPRALVDPRPRATVAGRIMLRRPTGKLVWLNLRDDSGDIQIAVSKRDCDEVGFNIAKACDLGDIVVAHGPLMKTRTGEVTIWASELRMGTKSLAPPPEKFKGLQDVEQRYRKRYIDLSANPETMRVMAMRSGIISRMRRYLEGLDFVEVETPILQTLAGGAAARPFVTHMNALDMSLFMRIAPELYLKRLLVGGMPRVFEFSRNFRNEGLSKRHNPEFTSLELYQAFGDYESMREITEGLIRDAAMFVRDNLSPPPAGRGPGRGSSDSTCCCSTRDRDAALPANQGGSSDTECGSTLPPTPSHGEGESIQLPFGELMIDYTRPFDRITFAELFERALGFPMTDHAKAIAEAEKRGFKTKNEQGVALDPILIVNKLFEDVAEPTIDPARPTFVFDYPAQLSPLTRPKKDDPTLAERWDIFIGGMEIGPAYTELNDPDIQEAKFREQLTGLDDEESTFRTFDEDFVNALKVGMPPAGGMGVGIDRICMLLMNQQSIRDVLLFPFMRPE